MRRALLLGGSDHDLMGITANLGLMREVLTLHGFEIDDTHIISEPTRDDIIQALLDLIERTQPGDTVVVYYCGHGGLAHFTGQIGGIRHVERVWNYIVPARDANHSPKDKRFGGVLSVELGYLLGERLAAKCDSVTLILECCYAAGIYERRKRVARGGVRPTVVPIPFDVPKFLDEPIWKEAPAQQGAQVAFAVEARSPCAVVVVAATSDKRVSYESSDSPFYGYFTKALADELRTLAGRASTWERIVSRVQRAIRDARDGNEKQFPVLIGPPGRLVFQRQSCDATVQYAAICEGEIWQVAAGRLHGFDVNDCFELFDDDGSLGRGVIVEVGPTRARVRVDGQPRLAKTMAMAELRQRANRAPVEIDGDSPTLNELRGLVSSSAWVREASDDKELLACVSIDQGRLIIHTDRVEREPRPQHPREDLPGDLETPCHEILDDLEDLARAQAFVSYCETLPSPPPELVCWMSVDGETFCSGDVYLDQPVNVGVRYAVGRQKHKFVNLVDHSLRGRLDVGLASNIRGGFSLYAGGDDPLDQGLPLEWPDELPKHATHETIWFLITSEAVDLSSLNPRAAKKKGYLGDPYLAEVECWTHRVDFTLHPHSRTTTGSS